MFCVSTQKKAMILFSTIVLFGYTLIISVLIYGMGKFKLEKSTRLKPETKFSVIIPFRNEEKNILSLVESLKNLIYPNELFEIILVDDNSEDNSFNKLSELSEILFQGQNFTLLNSKGSGKKEALTQAINHANNKWIVTTDADCIVPKNWLNEFDNFIRNKNTNFIAGPVVLNGKNSFFNAFQKLDFMSLTGTKIGSFGISNPLLCNGANLCYSKKIFQEVHGFEGNEQIASGDDVFLLQKMFKKNPEQVHYLHSSEAIVTTKPVKNLTNLISQRKRWAAKTSSISNNLTKSLGVCVLITNLTFIALLIQSKTYSIPLCVFITIKSTIDFILLRKVAIFTKQKETLRYYLPSIFLHTVFTSFIAIYSIFGGYTWKNRKYKR